MHYLYLLLLFYGLAYTAEAQTNISGVINSYHKVTGVNTAASGLKLDNIAGLAINDRVMIVQMKGGTITTANNSSYGSISAVNNAGNYELATICDIRSDSVFLLQTLLRSYTVTDKVQLVKIPVYSSAVVTDSLKALPWDSASGKGGVLAVIVSQSLNLQAPVSATGSGFSGGVYIKDGGNCVSNAFTDFNYNPTPTNYLFYSNVQYGAYKGESIADVTLNHRGAKGASANGGGGGNNHNNGGGGGSNSGAGGNGGDNLSTIGCTGQHAAAGGYALNNNGGARIFAGGGGGAGHANNTTASSGGGNGGGIVFIQAQTLISNGYIISANGNDGGNVFGDGAGGGGGGGTVIMHVNAYTDAVNIQAKGGNGGRVDDENTAQRCYGEGGGGGGGQVYFSSSQPTGNTSVAGGSKGLKLNSVCATETGAAGSAGSVQINYDHAESQVVSTCGFALSVNWLSFSLTQMKNNVTLHWRVAGASTRDQLEIWRQKENDGWKNISSMPFSVAEHEFTYADENLAAGRYEYRIRHVNTNGKSSYSPTRKALLKTTEDFIVAPNPASVFASIKGNFQKGETIEVFSSAGLLMAKHQFLSAAHEWRLNLSGFSNGYYLLRRGTTTLKMIIKK